MWRPSVFWLPVRLIVSLWYIWWVTVYIIAFIVGWLCWCMLSPARTVRYRMQPVSGPLSTMQGIWQRVCPLSKAGCCSCCCCCLGAALSSVYLVQLIQATYRPPSFCAAASMMYCSTWCVTYWWGVSFFIVLPGHSRLSARVSSWISLWQLFAVCCKLNLQMVSCYHAAVL